MKENRTPSNYLYLPKLNMNERRPLWSVIIPTYNCAHYLKETLQSVLEQDLGSEQMQILVVDDFSTKDNPEAVVQEMGQGRVEFFRQAHNVGKVSNYETGLLKSKGRFIHLLHGDDKVSPGFYNEMTAVFENNKGAGAAFCRSLYIDDLSRWKGLTGLIQDEDGIVEAIDKKLYVQQLIQTPSMVVKREVYETIGAFDRRLNCMEDWEMWIRIAHQYPIAVSNKVLAEYRTHAKNATNETFSNGSALETHDMVFKIVDGYFHSNDLKTLKEKRNKKQSQFLLLSYRDRKKLMSASEKMAFRKRILKLHFSLKTLITLFK